MDPLLEELYGPLHRIKFNDQIIPSMSTHNFGNTVKMQDFDLNRGVANHPPLMPTNPNLDFVVPSLGHRVQTHEVERALHDDFEFSNDVVLKYINQLLMDEEDDGKTRLSHEPSALEAKEKSFFEVLGDMNPPLRDQYDPSIVKFDGWKGNGNGIGKRVTGCAPSTYSGDSCGSSVVDPIRYGFPYGYNLVPSANFPVSSSKPPLQMSQSSSNSAGGIIDSLFTSFESSIGSTTTSNAVGLAEGPAESPVSALSVSDIFNDSQSILQFHKGLEEASKFLPKGSLYQRLSKDGISTQSTRGKKHRYPEDVQLEEPGNKQSAVSVVPDEAIMRSEMFDKVLLCSEGKNDADLRESLKFEFNKKVQNTHAKGSSGGRGRGRKQGSKRDVVDLRSLLTLCAQAVASNDQRSANDLLRQIRQHSSQMGDGNQRMAHYFADGLEARLAGVGTSIYREILMGPGCAIDFLRAYHMFIAMCPFKKIGNFYSNRSIAIAAEKATRLHIIDVGVVYGFQWPCLFQRLASRPGGPPKIRITGVDLPQPGFRPAKRLEETGNRLKNYAESFKIPFEFQAIAKKWETVTVEDLNIDEDELLVVSCLFRFKYIPEETAMVECPRDIILNLIREIKPAIFIQGVVNGAFNSPFFITRFREALFHFSTLFDMLEVTIPRETKERLLIERDIFGRQAMNVIACEGLERIERPETYKQWQVRIERAGFKQLPLKQEITDMAKKRVKGVYHKDFSIDEDGWWLLQGWKGRIVYALTTWVIA
ncbi:hypothetical protein RND81_03G173300 [Saponaria officinalis]|uniref:Scarecrow-like protein 9 n=1 Tax=Saponaria officinalis TaxID=3572 RepID=A0AAW1M950_SAPOF